VEYATILTEVAAAVADQMRRAPGQFGADTETTLRAAGSATAVEYLRAQQLRTRLADAFAEVFASVDVLATPATACTAPPVTADATTRWGSREQHPASGNAAASRGAATSQGFSLQNAPPSNTASSRARTHEQGGATAMSALRLTSPAFEHDQSLPEAYTASGEDKSPPLAWSGIPEGTQELVLVCDDPDAESGVFTHWLVYGLLPEVTSLPEGVPRDAVVNEPVELVQGLNDLDEAGYWGPSFDDERGIHRYFFRLFAIDVELPLAPGVPRAELRNAAKDHTLATAELVGIA
jgi:Raf kinase inhibitor-like YbhB/YbcL family protein